MQAEGRIHILQYRVSWEWGLNGGSWLTPEAEQNKTSLSQVPSDTVGAIICQTGVAVDPSVHLIKKTGTRAILGGVFSWGPQRWTWLSFRD